MYLLTGESKSLNNLWYLRIGLVFFHIFCVYHIVKHLRSETSYTSIHQ
jgi:hypothetical protein